MKRSSLGGGSFAFPRREWALVVAGLALTLSAAPAGAEPRPNAGEKDKRSDDGGFFAEVMVLHATNSKKGIDPRIGPMPELGKPPFSSYDSYVLLERARLPLGKETPGSLKLPNGRTLRTRLLEVLGADTVRLSANINQPNGKEFLPLLEVKAKLGQAFIVAGQSYKNGILVLVIRVVK
ncbi:MAG TPA: hypothetical protein VIM73_22685 [Polyangiaceae bacterium]